MNHVLDNINSLFQKKPPRPISGELAVSEDHINIGHTPKYNPDALVGRKGLGVYYEMRNRDEDVKQSLALKKHALLAPGGKPVLLEENPTATDKQALELIKTNIDKLPGSFIGCIKEILTAFDFGYSVTEKVWGDIQSGDFAGMKGLKALKTKPPEDFEFEVDKYSNLLPNGLILTNALTQQDNLPVNKFIIYSYQKEFNNWYGRSDLRAAYRSYWGKDFFIRSMNKRTDRLAVPPTRIQYKAGNSGNKTNALNLIKKLQMNSNIAHEEGAYIIDLIESTQNVKDAFMTGIEFFARGIARGILIPDRLSSAGTSGSEALARVHQDTFLWIIGYLQTEIEDVITEQLFKQMVMFNFPEGTAIPRWKFNPLTASQKREIIELFVRAVEKGIILPDLGDENEVRERIGFPLRDEQATSSAPPKPRGNAKPSSNVKKPTNEKEDVVPEASGEGKEGKTFARRTTKTKYEEGIDFQQINDNLLSIGEPTTQQLKDILTNQRDALTSLVSSKIRAGELTATFIGQLDVRFKADIKRVLKKMVDDSYKAGKVDSRNELPERFLAVDPGNEIEPSKAITYLESKTNFLVKGINDPIVKGTQAILIDALRSGEPVNVTVKRIQDLYLPYLADGGIIIDEKQLTDYRLEAIVRTHINESYNYGRRAVGEDKDLKDFVIGYQFSEILDDRTADVSRFVDRKIIPVNHPGLAQLTYPLHWNERGLYVFVTTDDKPVTFMSDAEINQAITMKSYP